MVGDPVHQREEKRERNKVTAPVTLPPRRCANCVFGHADRLCHRRGVNSGFYDWQTFKPTPWLTDAACFHHQYKPEIRKGIPA